MSSGGDGWADAPRPGSVFVEANRLRHHLVDWSRPGAAGPPVLLLHGLQEHSRAWDFVAPAIASTGRRVLALDWRGHGRSEWIGRGGYYHFADYVADLAFIVRHLGGTAVLVGHSMGGSAAVLYAGTEPQRVVALASVEGLGPPGADPAVAAERHAAWVEQLDAAAQPRASAPGRRPFTLEDATRRLAERFPLWPPGIAGHMALHGTRQVDEPPPGTQPTPSAPGIEPVVGAAGDAARTWRFDPLHRTRSPQPFVVAQARSFWRRVTCPVLYVEGTNSYVTTGAFEIDGRLNELGAQRATIEGAGHHPHLERPRETARILCDFLDRSAPGT